MKKLKNYFTVLLFATAAMFAVSCDDNDEIKVNPDDEFDVILEVTDDDPTAAEEVMVDAATASTITAKVAFKSAEDMKRLYITKNVAGAGEEAYEPTEDVDLKADGSVDLTGKNSNEFEYKFELPVESNMSAGTVVYRFWTTTGNGDIRDQSQRLAVGPGTITLQYGSGANPAAPVKLYNNIKLYTPTADAQSSSFFSFYDGKTYKISQGEEYVTFWDFGYINLQNGGPSLHSTSTYPTVAIPSLGDLEEDLNTVYFAASDKTAADFDAIATSSDLNFITESSSTSITDLVTGDIVEFVDQYGKKGLIEVISATPGNESNKYIEINIKVQP